MKYLPHDYQKHAEEHMLLNPAAGLFLDMGLGKTVITLTVLNRLLFELLTADKILVIAPKRVAEDTWVLESQKWDHLKHLRISLVLGIEKKRKEALRAEADIYVINVENVDWLIGFYGINHPFDTWVIDESSKFKNPKSKRFKALKQVRPKIARVYNLTGSPAPNSLLDIWAPMYLLDMGQRLGDSFARFMESYFHKENEYSPHSKYVIHGEDDVMIGEGYYEKKIYNKISDICISMKKEDYLDLPELISSRVSVILKGAELEKYQEFECEAILQLTADAESEADVEINAVNAAALNIKLMQFASGAVYDEDKIYHEVHSAKIEALRDILETSRDTGKTVIVGYWFAHTKDRIKKYLCEYEPHEYKGPKDKELWNEGKISFLLVQIASVAYGLNLQAGGHNIVAYEMPNWSLELWEQFIARIHRQGQLYAVVLLNLIVQGTIDEDMADSIEAKAVGQGALMNAVKARVCKYFKNLE